MHVRRHPSQKIAGRVGRVVGAIGVAAAASAGGLLATAGAAHASPAPTYSFTTLNNSNDPTFNQLLGINNYGVIAGYFGSGAAQHPNKGYYLLPGRTQLDYRIENFPGSTQTQVTGINDLGTQVGFYAPTDLGVGLDANFAWYSRNNGRTFHQVTIPNATLGTPAMTQLLGVNDHEVAVGFYTDAANNNHGFTYSIKTGQFHFTTIDGSNSVTDAAINNRGQIAGSYVNAAGATVGFLTTPHGPTTLSVPGSASTMATGVNDWGEVVGVWMDSAGDMHGFTWTSFHGFTTVNDPNGVNTTTVNGVNDHGDLVGFYMDAAGNTDGMLATPSN
jgi:hypothetical protein